MEKAKAPIAPMYCVQHGTEPTRISDGTYVYRVRHETLAALPDGHKERVEAIARAAASCMDCAIDYDTDKDAFTITLTPSLRST